MNAQGQNFVVHQFHYHLSEADAISNNTRFIQQALRKVGISGEIFGKQLHGTAARWAKPFRRQEVWSADLFLLHHSQGNPMLGELLGIEVPKALVYHNITPPQFFTHDSVLAELSKLGRKQLAWFSGHVVSGLVASQFNARDLHQAGVAPVQTFPLFDLPQWLAKRPPAAQKKARQKGPQLLFVGRLSPHKNQALCLETLFCLKQFLPAARLHLVGSGDPVYTAYLADLIRVLRLEDSVTLAGKLSDEQLTEAYREADLFLCLSQHEGFCIPLVEAMIHRLPILSYSHCALQETLGESAIHLRTENPAELAEIIHAVYGNRPLLENILVGQQAQLAALSRYQNENEVQQTCLNLLTALRHSVSEKGRRKPHDPSLLSPNS